MSGAKYYVWASGSWREVQTSGRVAGWQRRARFLFVRRGRLQLAPRGVLRALAAHAAGQPSAVRDGARLSQRSNMHGCRATKAPTTSDGAWYTNAHNRCKGSRIVGQRALPAPRAPAPPGTADTGTQCAARADAGTQASPAAARAGHGTSDIKLNILTHRKDTSDDVFQRKPTLKLGPRSQGERRARGDGGGRAPTHRMRSTSSDDRLIQFVTKKTVATIENVPPKNIKSPTKNTKLSESDSSDGAEGTDNNKASTNNKNSLRSPAKTKCEGKISDELRSKEKSRKRGNAETSDDNVKVIYDRAKSKLSRSRKSRRHAPGDEPGAKKQKINNNQIPLETKSKPTPMTSNNIIENLSDTSESDNESKLMDSSSDSGPLARASQRSPVKQQAVRRRVRGERRARGERGARVLELVVSESDVDVLRAFLERCDHADLEKFDTDDDYKRKLFHSINPVVSIERCARLERALRARALRRFTAGLGLRSVSEVSTQASIYKSGNKIGNGDYKLSSDSDAEEILEEDSSKRQQRDRSKKQSYKLNEQKSTRTRDRLQNESEKPSVSRHTSKKIRNKTNVLRSETTKDSSEDSSKNENTDSTKKLAKIQSETETKDMRLSSKTKARESIKNVTKNNNNKVTEHTCEHNSTHSDDMAEEQGTDRTSRSQTKKLSIKPSPHKSKNRRDSSKDNAKEPNKSRSKNSSNKPIAHQAESPGDSSEEDAKGTSKDSISRTKKASKKPRVHTSESPGDSSEETEDRSSRSHTKKLTVKPRPHKSGTARDSSEDTEADRNKKKHNHKSTTGKGKERSEQPRGAESRAEYKENVPQRANRLRGAGEDAGSGSEGGGGLEISREAVLRAARSSHSISKRPSSWGAKEYSNLEDHVIVSWVSGGARARRVNGNAVWRELQPQYRALAGRERTWHSLRNRYLRYILPALPALRLPPAHAARLRAAAATGEKNRRAGQAPPRRNSIFDKEPPARGAASRRPAPPAPDPTDPPSDEDTPPPSPAPRRSSGAAPPPSPRRSPRYSDVTRQFASRKLRSTPRSSVTSPRDPSPAPPPPPATRSRKLYNPNAML